MAKLILGLTVSWKSGRKTRDHTVPATVTRQWWVNGMSGIGLHMYHAGGYCWGPWSSVHCLVAGSKLKVPIVSFHYNSIPATKIWKEELHFNLLIRLNCSSKISHKPKSFEHVYNKIIKLLGDQGPVEVSIWNSAWVSSENNFRGWIYGDWNVSTLHYSLRSTLYLNYA